MGLQGKGPSGAKKRTGLNSEITPLWLGASLLYSAAKIKFIFNTYK